MYHPFYKKRHERLSIKIEILRKRGIRMIIRECNNHDAEKFLQMLQQLDKETKFMLFEPGERKTTVEQMQKSIESIVKSNSLQLVVEDRQDCRVFIGKKGNIATK